MILRDRVRGERLPLVRVLGWDDHPLAEGLATSGRVVCASGSVSLNTIPVRESPKTKRPARFTHGMLNSFEARQSGCHAVIASTMSS